MGGPGAFLALASLALPLAFGLMLQMMAPSGTSPGAGSPGSATRGRGSLVLLMLGVDRDGVGPGRGDRRYGSLRWPSVSAWYGGGPAGDLVLGTPQDRDWPQRSSFWRALPVAWRSARRRGHRGSRAGRWLAQAGLVRERKRPGPSRCRSSGISRCSGLDSGTFAAVHPYYKTRDGARNNGDEQRPSVGGRVGRGRAWPAGDGGALVLDPGPRRDPLGLGPLTGPWRSACSGSLVVLSGLFSAIHWTVELSAIALAASAVAGTANRWLAGGTDLFVDRGQCFDRVAKPQSGSVRRRLPCPSEPPTPALPRKGGGRQTQASRRPF